MGCPGGCGKARTEAQAVYPREITLSDGTKTMVSSAAQERMERTRAQQRERDASRTRGYSVQRG